jgi:hypothetical protein
VTSVWAANEAVSVIRAVNFMSYRDLCSLLLFVPYSFSLILVKLRDSNLTVC